jgi:hypothetical protein
VLPPRAESAANPSIADSLSRPVRQSCRNTTPTPRFLFSAKLAWPVQNGGAPGGGAASGWEDGMEKKDKEKDKEKKETPNPNRFWVGVLGASALAVAIAVGVIMQVGTSKPDMAAKPQPKTQAAIRTQAAVKPQTAVRPLTDAERKTSETLWAEQRKLDTGGARVMAGAPDGRRRVASTIAKHFNVPETLVNELRARKIGHGEITVALALSQQLMKREKMTQQRAVDRLLSLRKSGEGWGAIARSLGLKLADVVDHVQKIDAQLARIDTGKAKAARS